MDNQNGANMNVDHVNSYQAQRITRDAETQTVGNQPSTADYGLLNHFGHCIKNILTDNFLLQIENPETRAQLRNHNSRLGENLLICCGATGSTACALSGCYLDHSCSVLIGQTILGFFLGSQIGRNYEAFLQSEIKNQSDLLNTHAEIRTSAGAETITQQPESAPDTTVVAPPSYQSLLESGAIENAQVRCRGTHGNN